MENKKTERMEIESDKLSTAYHEAGHLIVAHTFGEAEYAELLDDTENCGKTKYRNDLEDIEQRKCVLMLLSGPISELRFRKQRNQNISIDDVKSNDFHRAKQKLGWEGVIKCVGINIIIF